MTLCVCGHPSEQHHQYDPGWYCEGGCPCDWYRKAVDSEESTASLPAGVTPEGLAEETVAGSVNEVTPPTDEARATLGPNDPDAPMWDDEDTDRTDEARAPEQTIEPRTEAGRALLAEYDDPEGPIYPPSVEAILAIEREAAAVAAPPLDVERLALILHGLNVYRPGDIERKHRASGELAVEIAAEYARLSQPSPDDR